jgi:putative acetyltransferase
MKIHAVTPRDLPVVAEIHRNAFATSDLGHNGEAELILALHEDGDAVCSLIGHILFSRMAVEADGQSLLAAGLAPVAVLPDLQRSGVGATLIEAGLTQLKRDGFQISFVLGHPAYYPRFGYRPELAAPFESPFLGPHFMALYLDSALTLPQRGRAEYAPAFARMG